MASPLQLLKRIVDPNEREVARLAARAERVLALESDMRALSDEQLRGLTGSFRERLARGTSLDELLPEAFAALREAADRTIGERPFKVQIMGGVALHMGMIAEMKTGEGKTLTATMPLYLNALPGKGAHLVTTNDFLVRWQAEWMGQIYEALGMSVGYIQHSMTATERRSMYRKDITYVENSELGFDYLRDNMAVDPAHLTQRELHYAIVDEADSILVDEARTPLIISGEASSAGADYEFFDRLTERMIRASHDDDPFFNYDKKDHQAALTEAGMVWVEKQLGMKDSSLVDPENIEIAQLIDNSLKAHFLYERDDEYVVKDGEVIIVDEFTGHLQPGRRYSDGLHQAIEAKERVYTPRVRQTVASITYQNFFRLYDKLGGMTGTAKSEEPEFVTVYGARVVIIPTNRPVRRHDYPDVIYKTQESKYRGIVNEIINMHVRSQPVLVGTRSVDVSEHLGQRLEGPQLRTHALVQVLIHELNYGAKVDKAQREPWLELLRRPIAELVSQATHLRRRARDDETNMAEIIEALKLDSDVLADSNLDRLLEIVGVMEQQPSSEQLTEYRQRLHDMLQDGMRPGDEEYDSQLNILNAKRHESEGRIISQAGQPGMVTIATNMAGRGVDIILGGRDAETGQSIPERYEEVKQLGGLHVIGSERHESRRIDNQLRGRSGRQGDEGSSRFHVSLEDDLMKFFGPERLSALTGGWPEEEPVAHRFVSKALERAQIKVEMRNMGIRKNTLRYDDVMNTQRSVVYEQRRRVLDGENVHASVERMIAGTIEDVIASYVDPGQDPDTWDLKGLYERLRRVVSVPPEAEEDSDVEIPAGGLSLKLAALHLQAITENGGDLQGYLSEIAEPHGELSRSMDPKRAESARQEKVASDIENIIARFSEGEERVPSWRLIDVARGLGAFYPPALDEVALAGLHQIRSDELNEVIPQMALEVYSERELALVDSTILQGIGRFANPSVTPDQRDLPSLESYLFSHLHDLREYLAVQRLKTVDVGTDASQWLMRRAQDAYEELGQLPQKAETERANRRRRGGNTPGTVVDASLPDLEWLSRRFDEMDAEYGEQAPELHRWDLSGAVRALAEDCPGLVARLADEELQEMANSAESLAQTLRELARAVPEEDTPQIGYREFRDRERSWLLASVDKSWMEHLLVVDELREGIHLRAHAQRDPLVEYQREASSLFDEMMAIIGRRLTQYAFSATEVLEDTGTQLRDLQATQQAVQMIDGDADVDPASSDGRPVRTFVAEKEPGRNDPCPCGSGKKYKRCCMLKQR